MSRVQLTFAQSVTVEVELSSGRVERLVAIVDEERTVAGIRRPVRIGGVLVAPGPLSDDAYHGAVRALADLRGKRW